MRSLNPLRPLKSLVPERGPQRVYIISLLINQFGFGLGLPVLTLYAVRVVHLPSAQVGLGMTIALFVGLLAAIPIGDLADRYGPREVVSIALVFQCASMVAYLFIGNFVEFLGATTLDFLAANAAFSADSALLRRVGGDDATTFRAGTKAVTNLGLSLGLVGSGFALQIGTPNAYRSLFLLNGVTFVIAWVLNRRLPRYEPLPKPKTGRRWGALTDKAFVGYAALNGAMSLQFSVLAFLVPLWIVEHTSAPRWGVSLVILVNTALIVLLVVRLGKNVKTVRNGGAAVRRAGVALLVSCAAMGFAAGLPGWAALLLLVGAAAVHTFGEMWHALGGFALEYGLAPQHSQGQYHGVSMIGSGIGQGVAPVILLALVLSHGRAGWLGLGVFFVLLGMLGPVLARWGERTRPPAVEPEVPEPAVVQN